MPRSGPARRSATQSGSSNPGRARLHPAGHPAHPPPPWNPVTAPAGARAAHPPPNTPARDHPHLAS